MKVAFHEEALADFREAVLYYATREPILAIRFIEAVEDAIPDHRGANLLATDR